MILFYFFSMTTNQFKVELWYTVQCLTHLNSEVSKQKNLRKIIESKIR